MIRRVVVTGMSGVTAFGNDWASIEPKLRACENATQYMPSYEQYEGLNTKLAAPIMGFTLPSHYKRKQVRGMGRVSQLATVATENALLQAGLIGHEVLTNGQTGIAYGSSTGSTDAIGAFGVMLNEKKHSSHYRHHLCTDDASHCSGERRSIFRAQRPCHSNQ